MRLVSNAADGRLEEPWHALQVEHQTCARSQTTRSARLSRGQRGACSSVLARTSARHFPHKLVGTRTQTQPMLCRATNLAESGKRGLEAHQV
eukprot:6173053-Pleurochrysis_carterae.AAC.5